MMHGSVVFGEVVGKILAAGIPENVELALEDAIAYPVVSHIDVSGLVLFDGVVGEASCG